MTKEKGMSVIFLPLIFMRYYLQVQGYFISLLFMHAWKLVWSEGLSHFSWNKAARGVPSSCSSHGSKVSPLSGKQQRMGRICSHNVPVWTSARVCSLSVPPDHTCVIAGDTPLEQPGSGLSVAAPMAVPAFKPLFLSAGCSASLCCLCSSHVSSSALQ